MVVPKPRFDPLYRAELLNIVQAKIDEHPRSAQSLIGPSGVGGCERKVAFGLAYGAASEGPGGYAAFKGTQLHRFMDETFSSSESRLPDGSPRFLTEVALESSAPDILSGGTADLIDLLHHRIIDHKFPGDFTIQKFRSGDWSESYFKQCQVYGLHASLMGHPVSTVGLLVCPMAGDVLHDERRGAILAYWDFDPKVAIDAIDNLRRIKTMLDIAPVQKVLEAMETRSDFCQSCPAHISSSDRRGTCPGALPAAPLKGNPFA